MDWWDEVVKAFEDVIEGTADAVADATTAAVDAAAAAAKAVADAAQAVAEATTDAARAAAQAALDVAQQTARAAEAAVKGIADSGEWLVNTLVSAAATAVETIKQITTNLVELGEDLLEQIVSAATSAWTETVATLQRSIGLPVGALEVVGVAVDPIGPDWRHEYILVRSRVESWLDLTGWMLSDAQRHRYRFPARKLAPGASLRIWTGPGGADDENLYMGRRAAIWNNHPGDVATLTDPQGRISHQRLVIPVVERFLEGLATTVSPFAHRLVSSRGPYPVQSRPRSMATAISLAEAVTEYAHDDTGVRYDFRLKTGKVYARRRFVRADGTQQESPTNAAAPGQLKEIAPTPIAPLAVSYHDRRTGEWGPPPRFDMIAASGSRVIAKQAGVDVFWFTSMAETFTARQGGRVPPSTYLKLDPEAWEPNAKASDLQAPLSGDFNRHPASGRFKLFQSLHAVVGLPVAVKPRVWHRIDARPAPGSGELPAHLPRYADASFMSPVVPGGAQVVKHSIAFDKVLDIGVGHVHWYAQESSVTGGEMQPLRVNQPLPPFGTEVPIESLYRLANGPVRDGDGFIDGTCNFYILVRLDSQAEGATQSPQRYALLWLDEQSGFTHRWREVHPDDYDGLLLALVKAINGDPTRYGFNKDHYWCPFRTGYITERSRLAAALSVLMVNGVNPQTGDDEIYSINFSYATMDRTWRWRPLPHGAEVRHLSPGAEIPSSGEFTGTSVYPETLGLREDMTIHLRGSRDGTAGRWVQSFLPPDGVWPAATGRGADRRPTLSVADTQQFAARWRFIPDDVYTRWDRFSHLGVLDRVDSRSRYHTLTMSAMDRSTVAASPESQLWTDNNNRLHIQHLLFDLAALGQGLQGPDPNLLAMLREFLTALASPNGNPMAVLQRWRTTYPAIIRMDHRPPSLFNSRTRLRLLDRGPLGTIAVHADKRDDDLIAFSNPSTDVITLSSPSRVVYPQITGHRYLPMAPAVTTAAVLLRRDAIGPQVSVELRFAPGVWSTEPPNRLRAIENVWLVHLAGMAPGGKVVKLAELRTAQGFFSAGRLTLTWRPATEQVETVTGFLVAPDPTARGFSLWCENALGQVAVPQATTYSGSFA